MATSKGTKEQNINVFVRIRPPTNQEKKYPALVDVISQKELTVKNSYSSKRYHFDTVFDPSHTQQDVYNTIVRPLIAEVIGGYNCTVFAYGQTGTGKTYTMTGEKGEGEGIIPKTLSNIFDALGLLNTESSVRVSYIQLYNEELFDMLSQEEKTIRIYEDKNQKGSVILQGIEEYSIIEKNQLYKILDQGAERRRTASTLINAHSSRSHTVFTIIVHTREITPDGEELVKTGKMNLVDLAGCENILRSGAIDIRAREAGSINQSLLTLGRVIKALTEKNSHVPYRESKLTRLLQDSLGGRTKTCLIATVSSSTLNAEETMSTLDYAMRARCIQNRPEVNQKISRTALINQYIDEIEHLKKDLVAARTGHGVVLDEENYKTLMANYESQRTALATKMTTIRSLQSEIDEKNKNLQTMQESWTASANKIETLSRNIQHSERELELIKNKTRYLENKNIKLVENEDTLHAKITTLYRNSDDNRLTSRRFMEVYSKLNDELVLRVDKSIDFVLSRMGAASEKMELNRADLEECYNIVSRKLDEIDELARNVYIFENDHLTSKNSLKTRLNSYFDELGSMTQDIHGQTLQFLTILREEKLATLKACIERISNKHDNDVGSLIASLRNIQKTSLYSFTCTSNSMNDLRDVVMKQIESELEISKNFNKLLKNTNNYTTEVVQDMSNKFKQLKEYMQCMETTFNDAMGKILTQQGQSASEGTELENNIQNFCDIIHNRFESQRTVSAQKFEQLNSAISIQLQAQELRKEKERENKEVYFKHLQSCEMELDQTRDTINSFFNTAKLNLSKYQNEVQEGEKTYDDYLDYIKNMCEGIETSNEAISTTINYLYENTRSGNDTITQCMNVARSEQENVKDMCHDKVKDMLEQVTKFCSAELNHPTHAGDTPQRLKSRSSFMREVEVENVENLDPNVCLGVVKRNT